LPSSQTAHALVDPFTKAYLPAGQAVPPLLVSPSPQYRPLSGTHAPEHAAVPSAPAPKRPAAQSAHASLLLAPGAAQRPVKQAPSHEGCAKAAVKRPAGQAVHASAPLAPPGLNWPGAHCVHEPGPTPLQPQPGSTAQVAEQPSPAAEPPSSQASALL